MFILSKDQIKHFTFRTKIFGLLFSICCLFIFIFFAFIYFFDSSLLKEQYSYRALEQARIIAAMPSIQAAVIDNDKQRIKTIVQRLQVHSDSSFISIADKDGIRLYHPEKVLIGQHITGLKGHKILKNGQFYLSSSKGSMGMSVRGMEVILDDNNHIVGVVAVVYLIERVNVWPYIPIFMLVFIVVFLIAIFIAMRFSRHIQKQMCYMEPEEIGISYQFQMSIMDAVNEGIIVFDNKNRVKRLNKQAVDVLNVKRHNSDIDKLNILEYVQPPEFILSRSEESKYDVPISIAGIDMIATRIVIKEKNRVTAKVISFRKEDDIAALTEELTQIQQYVDNLRVIKHEYANTLATIGGLLELKQYDKVSAIIQVENKEKQQSIDFIRHHIFNAHVAGLLIGKCARATELGCILKFDPSSILTADNLPLNENALVAIIGNLLDNAFESCRKSTSAQKEVLFFIKNDAHEFVIEVSDTGNGVKEEDMNKIFTKGVSSKNEQGHGIGLYLVQQLVHKACGEIIIENNVPQGAIFSIFIPLHK